MDTKDTEMVRGVKIMAATILFSVGFVLITFVVSRTGFTLTGELIMAAAVNFLGQWLLLGAWTGRTMGQRILALSRWCAELGVEKKQDESQAKSFNSI